MVKSQIKLLIVFLISSFLISFNAQAHHKENTLFKIIPWDTDKFEKKKDAQNDAKQKYCSSEAKARKKIIKLEKEETDGIASEVNKVEYIIEVEGYHKLKPTKINKNLPLKSKRLPLNFSKENTLLEVLKTYCVQLKSLDRPMQFKGSYLEDFYKNIAEENKFFSETED